MSTGAAYDVCQVKGWKSSLHGRPRDAKAFHLLIAGFTTLAVGLNFLGFLSSVRSVCNDCFAARSDRILQFLTI